MPEPRPAEVRARDGHWEHDPLWQRIRRQRPLLAVWAAREYQIRYRQSALGLLWSIAQPMALLTIYGAVLSLVLKVQTEGFPYISFAYAGLVSWAFVSTAISTGFPSTLQALPLVSKVYFPREIIPLGVVGASAVDLAVGTAILCGLVMVQGVGLDLTLVALVPIDIVLILWVAAACVAGAALTTFVRDLRHAVPVAMQLLFFGSPIMYPASLLPQRWSWIAKVNPIAVVVEATRDVVLRHRWPNWSLLAIHAICSAIALFLALAYTRSVEPRLVDVA